jgi:hypothetical protein
MVLQDLPQHPINNFHKIIKISLKLCVHIGIHLPSLEGKHH